MCIKAGVGAIIWEDKAGLMRGAALSRSAGRSEDLAHLHHEQCIIGHVDEEAL